MAGDKMMTIQFREKSVKLLEFIMAILMAEMAVLVFINVVMRYAFHSGINGTEDIARLSFIWLSFLGVVSVMVTGGHLGIDLLLQKLSPRPRFIVGFAGRLLMGWALGLLLYGSWQQIIVNQGIVAMGAVAYPLSWNYAAGLFAGVGGLLCVFRDIVHLFKGDLQCLTFTAPEDEEDVVAAIANVDPLAPAVQAGPEEHRGPREE